MVMLHMLFYFQLANIIWGDAGESDDHTVPYPNENEKKPPATFGVNNKDWNQEVTDVKPTEQTASGAKIQFHGNKQEHSTNLDINEGLPGTGFSMGSWSDLSSSNAAKTNQDSMGTKISSNFIEIIEYDTSRCGTTARSSGSLLC